MSEISRQRGQASAKNGAITEKAVPGQDEDSATLGIEAAQNALVQAECAASNITAVFFGSESKPYAVKPAAVTIAAALGLGSQLCAADLEFACKAGTEALRCALLHASVGGKETRALAVAADCAQARPGDDLEYTAGAGAAAFLVGPESESLALIEATTGLATDTPDFFRRSAEIYPMHGNRFTGQPAYFAHTWQCARQLLEQTGLKPQDFAHAVFHQPNGRFPREAGNVLGFKPAQLEAGMIVDQIGNPYAASSLIGLAAILNVAEVGQRVLCVSYGSGAGADGFVLRVTDKIAGRQKRVPTVRDYIERRELVDYASYLRMTRAMRIA